MKSSASLSYPWIVLGTVALIIVCAVSIRLSPGFRSSLQPQTQTTAPSASGVPAFTSAAFQKGDALTALGPEWTVIRQNDLQQPTAETLAGTTPFRETLVRLTGQATTMLITEYNIDDDAALFRALKVPSTTSSTIAGRDGYIVQVPSLTGGSAFVLKGETSLVMLQYGIDPNGNVMDWPNDVPTAIQSYIAAVKVR